MYPGWTGFPDHGYSDHRTLWCGDVVIEPHYSWVTGSYGTCSATCGGGSQTRSVVCKDEQGSAVPDSYCTGPKPSIDQACNTQSCAVACPALGPKVSWDGTDWEQGQSNPCWSYSSSCK
ncbi:MAG: thrombospondin type-1 domain-containing protein [Patescibacteria group bacterium]